jgi:molecular chaperone HscB
MNYFELFEIPIAIKIDSRKLAAKYVDLQKKFHPDFFSQASVEEQAEVMEKSAAINKALRVFQKRKKRSNTF